MLLRFYALGAHNEKSFSWKIHCRQEGVTDRTIIGFQTMRSHESPKRFLILGEPTDLHGHYVSWALARAGYRAIFINSLHDECPRVSTLYLDTVTDEFISAEWQDAEAAWTRRLPLPIVSGDGYGENEAFALREERRFTRWLIEMQQENSSIRWINCPAGAIAAENKLIQLKKARTHGIRVPRTLVTAQPNRFRAFLRTEETVVAKPLSGYSWEYISGETLTAFANILDARRASELSDEDIGRCVTMYQERIEKVSDVRMVVMGKDTFAYRIRQEGEQHFDFRIGFLQENHLTYEPIAVPAALREKMIGFMSSMRVNFASADFALKADGEWVFLDLNANGQWLFLEKASPDTRIGQKFCSFFVEGSVNSSTEELFPSFSEYLASDAARSFDKAYREHAAAQARSTNSWKESHV